MHTPNLSPSRRAPWPIDLKRWMGVLMALALVMSACSDDHASDDDETICSAENPCPDGQSCLQGKCIAREMSACATVADCPGGDYECIDSVCQIPAPDAGPDADANGAPGGSDTNNGPSTQPDTTPAEGPYIVASSPADGATDVALDTRITIEFSEAMDPTSMNFYSLSLRDANNFALDLDRADAIKYDPDTFTTTITPGEPLNPAEGYTIKVDTTARNERGVGLDSPATIHFSTAYEEPAEHAALARTWAPLIYQGVDLAEGVDPDEDDAAPSNPARPDADIPTRVDFDGNLTASDNLSNSKRASTPINAAVYYSVSEGPEYYFLHYILYYPSRYDQDARSEHDFSALTLVVDKASEALIMSENISPKPSGEVSRSFKPEPSPAKLRGGDLGGRTMRSFAPEQLADGTHYPLYVPAGTHEACHWYKSGRDGHCLHAGEQFPGPPTGAEPDASGPTSGVVLRPGDSGQTFDQATLNEDTDRWEMSYALVPIPSGLWALRNHYEQDGLFNASFPYKPQGSDRPTGVDPEQHQMLPKNLRSDAASPYGRTPFRWLPSPGKSNYGQWLLDPAYILGNRYRLGTAVSGDYCYNFYLNIDNRDDPAHPGCQD